MLSNELLHTIITYPFTKQLQKYMYSQYVLRKMLCKAKKKKAYKYVQDTATAIQYRRDNKSINVCNVRYTMIRAVRAIKTSCLQSYTAGHTANCYPFGKSLWQHVKRIIRLYKFLTWSS